ncbi:MAG: protein kinase [Candidatus Sumerlaeia bacterium]|nr:protein kinase [Candidatus Sumerlaeia bacterium]
MSETEKPKKFPFKPAPTNPNTIHQVNTVRMDGKPREEHTGERFAKLRESSITPLPDDIILKDGEFRVGPYIVSHQLARGGMGAVYKAEDPILARKVAIKIMAAQLLNDDEAVRRFQREARATAKIDHPNIARIYMVGQTTGGEPFIAMEFVDGGTLEGMIRRQEVLPFSIVADFLIQACEGLNAGLKQSIIHRDIKPANIMITENNVIKVVDFGLAKLYNEETMRTMAGMVMGTPRYMSPEQAQGREVDHRSDIYSLGATFYHLLAGVSPFDGENPTQIMLKQVTSPLTPLRNHKADIPLEFDELIRKCMMKEPMQRYQRYEDLMADAGKIKLQWLARERGNPYELRTTAPAFIAAQHHGGDSPAGMPIPAAGSPASREVGRPHGDPILDGAPQPEPTPMWRWVVIGASAAVVLIAVLVGIISSVLKSNAPEVAAEDAPPKQKTGLQVLIDAIRTSQNTVEQARPGIPEVSPDYLSWQATERIMENLANGVSDYEIKHRKAPRNLESVVREDLIFQNFDVTESDEPLDGWGSRLDFLPGSKTIVSAGLDQRLGTEDDLKLNPDEPITAEDYTGYTKLMEEEEARLNPKP